jgi:hypothetical protein
VASKSYWGQTAIFNLCIFDRQEVKCKMSFRFRRAKKSKIITFSSTGSPRLFIIQFSNDSKATTNRINLIMRDNRRIVGSIVHAKAFHVINEAECGGRCGRNNRQSSCKDKSTRSITTKAGLAIASAFLPVTLISGWAC